MTRTYEAPRELVWEVITEPRHVIQWWGGAGCSNPICEMDVRPGGDWRHVMRFADGRAGLFEPGREVQAPGLKKKTLTVFL
jgi:uncharacterized protein YndB with AHSA1/START domain